MKLQHIKIKLALAALTTAIILAGDLSASAAVSAATSEAGVPAPVADNEAPSQTADSEVPPFSAYIDFAGQGYAVFGAMEFPDGTCRVQNLYSLDGENYELSEREWLIPETKAASTTSGCAIKTPQFCMMEYEEPLKSYLAGTLDRFYLKLLITRDDGTTYESEPAVIERNREPQPVPEGYTLLAGFDDSMRVFDRNKRCFYGKCQLTVTENTTADEIASYLPQTLPIQVQVGNVRCAVDCPVTWKPLTATELTPGESVIIADAAETIYVPAGTLLDTPIGVFRLDEPLRLGEESWAVNEVQLILNVISADEKPSGSLAVDRGALKIALTWKPTGATAIRAYTLTEGENEWVEIQGQLLEKTLNAQLSTPNGGATILDADAEPIRSYLEADAAGNTPTPFLAGIKIEGGVYDGKQLVLPWPEIYGDDLPYLPVIGGSGGNESNAGSDNKDDSTDDGQRPNLPQQPEDTGNLPDGNSGETHPDSPAQPENGENPPQDRENEQNPDSFSQPESIEHTPQGSEGGQNPDSSSQPENIGHTSQSSGDEQNPDHSAQPENSENLPESSEDSADGQRPNLPQPPEKHQEETVHSQAAENSETGHSSDDTKQVVSPAGHETMTDAGDGQRAHLPQKLNNQKTTTKNNTGRLIALGSVVGAGGIAGVCAAISGKSAIALSFHIFSGKIRSILHGMIRR